MQRALRVWSAGTLAVLLVLRAAWADGLSEVERLAEYRRRGLSYPPTWTPDTPGWRELCSRREMQMHSVRSMQQRWDGWTSLIQYCQLVHNYTRQGFAVARTPPGVQAKLRASLDAGLALGSALPFESMENVIRHGMERPRFVRQERLNREVLHSLKPLHETWSGVELEPVIAYGLRVYPNGSTLLMHVDKITDHVISSIVHVGHDNDDDSEPWPIVIEGFDGSTTEVNLDEGDMLFYESAKCMHGRPRPFRGRYYSSLFVHYRPVGWPLATIDSQYSVPPNWVEPPPAALGARFGEPAEMQLISTGHMEPSCEHGWCSLASSRGPRPQDVIVTPRTMPAPHQAAMAAPHQADRGADRGAELGDDRAEKFAERAERSIEHAREQRERMRRTHRAEGADADAEPRAARSRRRRAAEAVAQASPAEVTTTLAARPRCRACCDAVHAAGARRRRGADGSARPPCLRVAVEELAPRGRVVRRRAAMAHGEPRQQGALICSGPGTGTRLRRTRTMRRRAPRRRANHKMA